MSRTRRWYHKYEKYSNPLYYKHEYKTIRQKIHRSIRKMNKTRLQKEQDIEVEDKTGGWITW